MHYNIEQIIDQALEDHAQNAGKDMLLLWFEQMYSKLRGMPWNWNMIKTYRRTLAPTPHDITVFNPLAEWVWTQGSAIITTNPGTNHLLSFHFTGRYILLGDEWYRVVLYPDAQTIRVNRPVHVSGSGPIITFYRRDFAVRATGIKSVFVDRERVELLTDEQEYRYNRGVKYNVYGSPAVATPFQYNLDRKFSIPPPNKPPDVAVGVGGTTEIGTHEIILCRVDYETGLMSPPSPSAFAEATAANRTFTITYNGVANVDYDMSYRLIAFMSRIDTGYQRRPMWYIGAKDPADVASTIVWNQGDDILSGFDDPANAYVDADDQDIWSERLYVGPQVRGIWIPAPDEMKSVEVVHSNGWHARPYYEEHIDMGSLEEILELFNLYIVYKLASQGKNASELLAAKTAFNTHLKWLLSHQARDLDINSWDYAYWSPAISDDVKGQSVYQDDDLPFELTFPW